MGFFDRIRGKPTVADFGALLIERNCAAFWSGMGAVPGRSVV
jgi:hypothetical protein